jgi:hypothetical protein
VVRLARPLHLVQLPIVAKPLQCNKLQLMLHLVQGGWAALEKGFALRRFAPDGPLQFLLDIARPLSYFAALWSVRDIIAKHVRSMRHDGPDNYYRCLLLMSEAEIRDHCLQDAGEPHSDVWFKQQLNDCEIEDDPEPVEDVAIVPAPIMDDDMVPPPEDAGPIVPIVPDLANWKRCRAVIDSLLIDHKVFFDNCSHQNQMGRGWANCSHGCIKYDFCYRHRSKEQFCSTLALWATSHDAAVAAHPDVEPRRAHLKWLPTQQAVESAMEHVTLTPF